MYRIPDAWALESPIKASPLEPNALDMQPEQADHAVQQHYHAHRDSSPSKSTLGRVAPFYGLEFWCAFLSACSADPGWRFCHDSNPSAAKPLPS